MGVETGRSRRFACNGVSLAYDDLGDADATPLVLLHGGATDRENWADVVALLAADNRLLPVDLAGYGESDRAPGNYSVPDHGKRIATLCEQVADSRGVIIGHSLGALVAAYVASTRPDVVRAAVLEEPPMFIVEPDIWPSTTFGVFVPMLRSAMEDAQRSDDPVASLRSWVHSLPGYADMLGPDGVERSVRSWAKIDPVALGSGSDDPIDVRIWNGHDPDTPIGCPVLVLRAEVTPAFAPEHEERFRRLAPQATFVLAEGSGHGIHIEKPEWFADQVRIFVAGLR